MWPNGGWPRSWPSPIASTRSSFRRSARATVREIVRHLERVGQACAVVVPARRDEHLRLVRQPAERLAVDDPVAVALKRRAQRRSPPRPRPHAPDRSGRQAATAVRPPARATRSAKPAATVPALRRDAHRSIVRSAALERPGAQRSRFQSLAQPELVRPSGSTSSARRGPRRRPARRRPAAGRPGPRPRRSAGRRRVRAAMRRPRPRRSACPGRGRRSPARGRCPSRARATTWWTVPTCSPSLASTGTPFSSTCRRSADPRPFASHDTDGAIDRRRYQPARAAGHQAQVRMVLERRRDRPLDLPRAPVGRLGASPSGRPSASVMKR